MPTKEEFYGLIQELRGMLQNPENLKCPCPKPKCEWHGKCRECVAVHRFHKDHVPNCFQQFVNEKLKVLADLFELEAKEKKKTPSEFWDYVRERDRR